MNKSNKLDIAANRETRKYSFAENLRRLLWVPGRWAFRLTPRPLFSLRRLILRLYGASVGRHVHVYSSTRILMPWNLVIEDWAAIGEEALVYNVGEITIGKQATVSHRAHLCAGTHDYTDSTLPLMKEPIHVGSKAWICADAFIGPGVTVGEGAVVGARAVVMKDVPGWKVVAGNPAVILKDRDLKDGD